VINKWKERPVFGWGFSDVTRAFSDGHVGNQSLLLISGIVGFVLMIGFMIYFCVKLLLAYRKAPANSVWKKPIPVFVVFLTGWFFIHSTSGQHFNYMVVPMQFIPQAVFFSFGALIYNKVKQSGNVKSI
jgi:O-antigen ligase